MNSQFLPISRGEMEARGWETYDFLFLTADAYVDHPTFGAPLLARMLEGEGYRVALLPQPKWNSPKDILAMGRPKFGVLISGGNVDSMVAHYSVAKKRRNQDDYSPGGKIGFRPDRPTLVYTKLVREAFGDIPVVIGGIEASLRRFAHYDYWQDKVRPSILEESGADLLIYGMGERPLREVASRLASGTPVEEIRDVRGTCFFAKHPGECLFPKLEVPSAERVMASKRDYAVANRIEYDEHDPVRGKALLQRHTSGLLVCNPPGIPLSTEEMDRLYSLPFLREWHPSYESKGGIPAIEEVQFSLAHNRGCFGACHFCALAFHQGRVISSRSHESVVAEAKKLIAHPAFKGYIHDVGGPTANFRRPACKKQAKHGVCTHRACLSPEICPNMEVSHRDYLELLRKVRTLPGVKKVFIRSGIRFDYLLKDKDGTFFSELVQHHVSGQLKVAPEHCVESVLHQMGKPNIQVYEKFKQKYDSLNQKHGKDQYLVPYLISSHPGCTLEDGVQLAQWLNRSGRQPEQVQDFYPTPGTLSTCMYYTGLDPRTMEPVHIPKDPHEKAMQRALMQWKRPEKRRLVLEALHRTGRTDLIGFGKECLLRPERATQSRAYGAAKQSDHKKPKKTGRTDKSRAETQRGRKGAEGSQNPTASKRKAGWAVAKKKPNKKR